MVKLKWKKQKKIKEEIGRQLFNELRSLKRLIIPMTKFQELLVSSKMIIIRGLNKAKSIGTMMRTSTGLKTVNPEGYVAIDNDGKAVKLVDRMEFSQNNFNQKNWDK